MRHLLEEIGKQEEEEEEEDAERSKERKQPPQKNSFSFLKATVFFFPRRSTWPCPRLFFSLSFLPSKPCSPGFICQCPHQGRNNFYCFLSQGKRERERERERREGESFSLSLQTLSAPFHYAGWREKERERVGRKYPSRSSSRVGGKEDKDE